MIGTIRKHSKVLWGIVITVVIITFVFWGAQPGDNGRGGGEFDFGSIAGKPIKREAFADAYREVSLLYFFSAGDWPKESAKQMGFDVDRETYYRLLMLRKVEEAGIHVSDETVARVAGEFLRNFFRGQPVSMDLFEKNVLARGGLTALDFERYIRNLLAIQQLMTAHGLAGRLVTPQETRLLYERENEELVTEAVFFSASNQLASVSATPQAVGEFFTNQMARYRVPERVSVSYVAFEVSDFLAQSEAELVKTNLVELIEANYQRLGTNFFQEAKTPEEKRAKVRENLIQGKATLLARQQANEFANTLDKINPKTAANLEKLAGERQLTVKVTELFDREEGPKELKAGPDFLRDAFNRTADEPFAGPLAGADAVYVIAQKDHLPSEIPPLEKIRDRVTADYKLFQAAMVARRAGSEFAAALTNGLAAGKTFSSLCVEAGVKPVIIPPLSLSSRTNGVVEEHVSLRQYTSVAFATPVGQVSQFVPTMEGGFVVFVREKLPIDLAKMTADLPAFATSVRQTRQGEAYNEWFRREAERGLRDIPAFRQPQQQLPGGLPQ